MVSVGDSFLVPSGPGQFKHLFVVCSGPSDLPDFRLVVSVTSIREGVHHDPACILQPGMHDFIRHPSYIDYRHAERRSAAQIERLLASGYFIRKAPVSPPVLQAVLKGFETSDFAEPWTLKMLYNRSF